MARIKFSPLIVAASGKVADTVFSIWKGRAYIRARVTPANPNSAAQQLVRNSMTRVVNLWQSLVADVVAAWNLYAGPYTISGYNAFVKSNRADEQAGTDLETTPYNGDIDKADSFSAAVGVGSTKEIDLTWSGGSASADHFAYILTRENGVDAFVLNEEETTLFSAGSKTITVAKADTLYFVTLANEVKADDAYSASLGDSAKSKA